MSIGITENKMETAIQGFGYRVEPGCNGQDNGIWVVYIGILEKKMGTGI